MSARPLVAVTRDESPDGPLSAELVRRGADVLNVPVLATVRVEDPRLAEALAQLADFDWLVFTSRRAVLFVADHDLAKRLRTLPRRPGIAAAGSSTAAALTAVGLAPDVVAADAAAGAAGLGQALRERAGSALRGARVLWPRASGALPQLREELAAAGAEIVDPVVYETRPTSSDAVWELRRKLDQGVVAAVAFLSPSSALALALGLGGTGLLALKGRTLVASIGPTTSAALRANGAPPDVESIERTIPGLADALMARLSARSRSHA